MTNTIPTATEIYDAIMAQINPDLVSTSGVQTDVPLPGETPIQFAGRTQRYASAFTLYERCLDAYVTNLKDQAHTIRLQKRVSAESEAAAADAAAEDEILQSIANA